MAKRHVNIAVVVLGIALVGTFPPLKGTPPEYLQALGSTSTKVFPINPGELLTF